MVRDAPKRKGFTLQLDAVIFLIVVAILSLVAVLHFSDYSTRANVARCKTELSTLAVAVNQYAYEMHAMPDFTKLAATGTYPSTNGVTYGPWIHTSTPLDPWGTQYELKQTTDKKGYVVFSKGPDKNGTIADAENITAAGNKLLGIYIKYKNGTTDIDAIAYYGRFGEPIN